MSTTAINSRYLEIENTTLEAAKCVFAYENCNEVTLRIAIEPWAAEVSLVKGDVLRLLVPKKFEGELEFGEYSEDERMIGLNVEPIFVSLNDSIIAALPKNFPTLIK